MALVHPFSDPSVDGPGFKFGLSMEGVAAYYPYLPPIPGGASKDWHISEWHAAQVLDPATVRLSDASQADTILGVPSYSWVTPNGNISLSAYPTSNGFGYRLGDHDGVPYVDKDGGQNLFLETNRDAPQTYTFDHPITFTAQEALTSTSAGGIAQQVGNNFTIGFNLQGTALYDASLPTYSAFLQYQLSDSRDAPGEYMSLQGNTLIYNMTGGDTLPFRPSAGLSDISIDLNAGVQAMARAFSRMVSPDDRLRAALPDLARWNLGGMYIGEETMTGGGMNLDVLHPMVTMDDQATYSGASRPVTISGGDTPGTPRTVDVGRVSSAFRGDGSDGLVSTSGGQDTVTAGELSLVVYGGAHDLTFINGSGTSTVSSAGGLVAVGGTGSITAGGTGPSTILFGGTAGHNTLMARDGTEVMVGMGGGNDHFLLAGTGDHQAWALASPNSSVDASASTGTDIIVGAADVHTGAGTATVFMSTRGSHVTAGSGRAVIVSGGGPDTITGGADTEVWAGSGITDVQAGTGHTLVIAGAHTSVRGSAAVGSTSTTYDGPGGVLFVGGAGSDMLVAGSGGDRAFAGKGTATVFGGYGSADVYCAIAGTAGGVLNAMGFRQGTDHIVLSGYGQDAAAAALNGATYGGGGATLHLRDGTAMFLSGVGHVGTGDFI